MAFEITRVDVWATELLDRAGALAVKLQGVMEAGADLDFAIARRQPEKPGTSVLFVAPLRRPEQIQAAEESGFRKAKGLHSIRVVGPNRPGLAAGIARALADAGINVRGLSGAAVGDQCIFYIALETDQAAVHASQVLTRMLG